MSDSLRERNRWFFGFKNISQQSSQNVCKEVWNWPMACMLNMKNRFKLTNSCFNNSSFIKPTFFYRIKKLWFHIFLKCSDSTKNYSEDYFKRDTICTSYPDAILIDQFSPNEGAPFDVTLYRFFEDALKNSSRLKNLTPEEIEKIKKNLEVFKQQLLKDKEAKKELE